MNYPSTISLIFGLLATSLHLAGAAQEEIRLWPKSVPGKESKLEAERDMTKGSDDKIAGRRLIRLGNVSEPTITVYPAPKEKAHGGAVLVCPGGGYHILALDVVRIWPEQIRRMISWHHRYAAVFTPLAAQLGNSQARNFAEEAVNRGCTECDDGFWLY